MYFLFNVPYFSKVPELRPPKQKTKKKAHKKSFSLEIGRKWWKEREKRAGGGVIAGLKILQDSFH